MKPTLFILFLSTMTYTLLDARVYCKNLKNCQEACFYLKQGNKALDRDKDGIPCEKLCHSPCDKKKNSNKKTYRPRQ